MLLAPCPGCRRHIAGDSCPFCGQTSAPSPTTTRPLGRVSRAVVFAGAAALTPLAAGCGPKPKPAEPESQMMEPPQHHGGGGCAPADPAKVKELEQKKADAKTDEERAAIEQELQTANEPVCMPYGAPPSRRRVV